MTENLKEASEILRRGGVGIFATETVYGIGADATNDLACARIFDVKERPRFNPLIVHLAHPDQLSEVAILPDSLRPLVKAFWPGPLTLVLPKSKTISDLVTAGLDTVAVRIPRHPLALELLAQAQIPVAAPSANRFGQMSATRFENLDPDLLTRVDFALDGGPCEVGVESTIVGLFDGKVTLLRPGGISLEAIEAITGPLALPAPRARPLAPGMLKSHYAPRTKLVLFSGEVPSAPEGAGLLLFKERAPEPRAFAAQLCLSPRGDSREAAANLFAFLKLLDDKKLSAIYAERAPDTELGRAINDRLTRASHSPQSK